MGRVVVIVVLAVLAGGLAVAAFVAQAGDTHVIKFLAVAVVAVALGLVLAVVPDWQRRPQ